jgi:putative endopeptidase
MQWQTTRLLGAAAMVLVLAGCERDIAPGPATADIPTPPRHAGVVEANMDRDVAPGDDFYRYVNGGWLERTEIPADRANYGTFTILAERAEQQVHALLEELAEQSTFDTQEDRQLALTYRSFMDVETVNARGKAPIEGLIKRITDLESTDRLPELLGSFAMEGIAQPLSFWISQDARDATTYIAYLHQFGQIGLPDRSFYLDDDARFVTIRAAYVDYMAGMLERLDVLPENAGDDASREAAEAVLKLETALAEAHWTRVESRDRERTYNRYALDTPEALGALSPDLDLKRYFDIAGLTGKAVIVMQPEAITALGSLLDDADLPTVQHYLALQVARQFAPMLSSDFVDAHFDFYARTLRGTDENRPRWTRAVAAVDDVLGEALGKRYVAAHFPPEAKARMERMVGHLTEAYRSSIESLDWMSDATRDKALEKLSRFGTKIGHPETWRDYTDLLVEDGDVVGNYLRATAFETQRQLAKQGQPVDRGEWFMTPQTVNAYYNPTMNEIVFPAAILQPPFFDLDAEDAVNYGAIGAVIGHEIGHGFDDQGSKYDGLGNLNNWWTDEDRAAFEARTEQLIAQYNAFCPLEDHCVNGALALGENIGDLGGLSIAYKAYLRSVGELPPPIIDGYTAEQRLFIGWAQVWARKFREQELVSRLRTGPHAPDEFRANGTVRNIDAWYEAFDVGEDAALYLPPDERVRIW